MERMVSSQSVKVGEPRPTLSLGNVIGTRHSTFRLDAEGVNFVEVEVTDKGGVVATIVPKRRLKREEAAKAIQELQLKLRTVLKEMGYTFEAPRRIFEEPPYDD